MYLMLFYFVHTIFNFCDVERCLKCSDIFFMKSIMSTVCAATKNLVLQNGLIIYHTFSGI